MRYQFGTGTSEQSVESKISSRLDIQKIGICGIPSLWMSREDLIANGYLYTETIEEQERLELMLRILQSHKKYENDKYFGGSIFKKATNIGNGLVQGNYAG